jgi:gamma-glutamyltranspeptidase / glutathione hydrolase
MVTRFRCAAVLALLWWSTLSLVGHPAETSHLRVVAEQGIVVSVSAPASEVGLAVLQEGGNAVDAAVATAFALAVTWPAAGNIGGGGFMMVGPAGGQRPVCIEYRETAPAAAHARTLEQYARLDGPLVCGTPGTVAGLALAHRTYGKRPWRALVLPAVRLAREGVIVNGPLASSLNGALRASRDFAELQRVFAPPAGKEWRAGDRLVQSELARTLERIATDGPAAFYTGPIADQLVGEMQAGGGLISKQDLAGYQAHVREPIHGTYRGYDVYASPPPSSGGTCLVEMLNILENFSLRDPPSVPAANGPAPAYSARAMHLIIEAMRRTYCDRARWLGDGDFVKIPPELTSKEYARELARQIDQQRATPSESLAVDIPLADESPETTHFSVVDRDGMAVANTYTLENSFGCRVVVRGAGFLLNNEMTDFNRVPGRTDRKGMIGTAANLIAPGKRMLSSQTPTLVFRDGRLVLVTGSPGGRTIINTVLCTVVNVVDFQRDVRAAIDAPRLHQQWFPDRVSFEALARPECAAILEQLRQMGHTFADKPGKQGDAHSIGLDPQTGQFLGVPDRRIDGHAAGR